MKKIIYIEDANRAIISSNKILVLARGEVNDYIYILHYLQSAKMRGVYGILDMIQHNQIEACIIPKRTNSNRRR